MNNYYLDKAAASAVTRKGQQSGRFVSESVLICANDGALIELLAYADDDGRLTFYMHDWETFLSTTSYIAACNALERALLVKENTYAANS